MPPEITKLTAIRDSTLSKWQLGGRPRAARVDRDKIAGTTRRRVNSCHRRRSRQVIHILVRGQF